MGTAMKRAAALALALALVATAAARGQNLEIEKALVAAEATWATKKPAAYEFTIQVSCFCPLPKPPPTFSVRNGVATLRTKPDDPRLSSSSYSFYSRFNTIEKLFTTLRDYLRQQPSSMVVRYDPQLGYPVSAEIDVSKMVFDDELSFRVSNFTSPSRSGGLFSQPLGR